MFKDGNPPFSGLFIHCENDDKQHLSDGLAKSFAGFPDSLSPAARIPFHFRLPGLHVALRSRQKECKAIILREGGQ